MKFKRAARQFGSLVIWATVSLSWVNLSQAFAESGKGVGPVKELKLEAVNSDMAAKGKTVFNAKCSACHKLEERYVGPALKDVTKRRAPEWIMNMILAPKEMLEQDETAKELLGEFLVPMTFQNITQDESRQILEYFREYDLKGPTPEKTTAPVSTKKQTSKKSK